MNAATPTLPDLPEGVVAAVPMRNLALFSHVLVPTSVGRAEPLAAVRRAGRTGATLGLVMQKDAQADDSGRDPPCQALRRGRIAIAKARDWAARQSRELLARHRPGHL